MAGCHNPKSDETMCPDCGHDWRLHDIHEHPYRGGCSFSLTSERCGCEQISDVPRDIMTGQPVLTFDEFCLGVKELLGKRSENKGYSQSGESDLLSEFVRKMGLSHPEGEICYKIVRYHQKGDKEDLLKIAAWAMILWRTKCEDSR